MQSFWSLSKNGQPPKASQKDTLTELAMFCEKKRATEEQLQRRIEEITAKIKATPRGRVLTPAEKKRCLIMLLEKRQCERNLDSVSEQRLRATFAYHAIQRIGHDKEFVGMMKNANDCMQEMGIAKMRDEAEHASDTASDLASYNKELEDALQHFGGAFSTDDTELNDELNEILGLPGDGVAPGVLAETPRTSAASSVQVSSSSFPKIPAIKPSAVLSQTALSSVAKPAPKVPASIVSV